MLRRLLRGLVRAYQLLLSPVLGPRCRYLPTCSDYAMEALERHGAARGTWLAALRLLRCHPCAEGGYDPVPETGSVGFRRRHPHFCDAPAAHPAPPTSPHRAA